jgi:maltose alpha-D-glucosyltransferase/alpha-amylase
MREQGAGTREQELIEFLKTKRWFGEKGREIRGAVLKHVIPVEWPGLEKAYAVARAEVAMDEGTATYQLFLVQDAPTLSDAIEEAEFRRFLADMFIKGAAFERDGTRWVAESEGKKALVVPPNAPIALASAEQSNSSVIMNREAILKLYRRIEPGIHPDVEVTRFLTTERRFVHVPVLLGTIRFEDASGVSVAGMLQEYVQGAVDGWTFALDSTREYFEAGDGHDPALPFEAEAEQLGVATRAMHEALASGDPGTDFDLRAAGGDDVQNWAALAVQTIERASRSLAQALERKQLPSEHADQARAVAERRPGFIAWIKQLADDIAADAGGKTRTHGDYHLGQVLRSAAAQFLIIDFEGEPSRPLDERRARSSPLRDVAGMLRSFAYAAAAGSKEEAPSSDAVRDARATRWIGVARDAFLRGYFSEKGGRAGLLPNSQNNTGRLISLFKTEKMFYELQYELDHRPEWVSIPLRDIAKLNA